MTVASTREKRFRDPVNGNNSGARAGISTVVAAFWINVKDRAAQTSPILHASAIPRHPHRSAPHSPVLARRRGPPRVAPSEGSEAHHQLLGTNRTTMSDLPSGDTKVTSVMIHFVFPTEIVNVPL